MVWKWQSYTHNLRKVDRQLTENPYLEETVQLFCKIQVRAVRYSNEVSVCSKIEY